MRRRGLPPERPVYPPFPAMPRFRPPVVPVGQPFRPPPYAQPLSQPRPSHPTKQIVELDRSGIVDNYNDNGWGFITVYDEPSKKTYNNIFVHRSGLKVQGETLEKGVAVKFDIAAGKKGFEAVNVSLLQVPSSLSRSPPSAPKSEPAIIESDRRGEVIEYDSVKRFGIVKTFDTETTYLAHHTKFKPPLTDLSIGQIVKFDIIQGSKGPLADKIEVLAGTQTTSSYSEMRADRKTKPPRSRSVGRAKPPRNSRQSDAAFVPKRSTSICGDTPTFVDAASDELQCCMCIDLLSLDSVQAKCEHYYCRECIVQWLNQNRNCPLCKKSVCKEELTPVPRVIKNLIEKAWASQN